MALGFETLAPGTSRPTAKDMKRPEIDTAKNSEVGWLDQHFTIWTQLDMWYMDVHGRVAKEAMPQKQGTVVRTDSLWHIGCLERS